MNYLDVIISVSSLYGLIKGFSNGIIKELTNIISLISAIYIGVHFSVLVEPYLSSVVLGDYQRIIPLLAFLIVFIVILIIIKSIGELIDKVTKLLALGLISRFLGAIFGALKIMVVFSGIIFFLQEYKTTTSQMEKESILLSPIEKLSQFIIPEIDKHTNSFLEKTKEETEKAKETIENKINQQ